MTDKPEVLETKEIQVSGSSPADIQSLLSEAVKAHVPAEQSTAFIEMLERLVGLHERVSAKQALISYNNALANFQMECPPVTKGGTNQQLTNAGTGKAQTYARLEEDILPVVTPFLLQNGFSYSWDTDTYPDRVEVTCKLKHIEGHEETARFGVPPDDRSNRALSPAQKFGAVLTYCKRLTLSQVAGIRIGDGDSDAAPGEPITEGQALDLETMISDSKSDRARFLKFMSVENLEDMRASEYPRAMNFLKAKLKQAEATR